LLILSVSLWLVTQHTMNMRHTVICGVSGSAIFLHIILQRARFSKKIIEHNVCFGFSYNFVLNITHCKKIQRDIIINVDRASCKVRVILVRFYEI